MKFTVTLLLAAAALCANVAAAADVRVLSTLALRSVMEEMMPQFERTTGHRVLATFDTSNLMADRVRAGDAVDLAILTPALIDEMAKLGRIQPGSNVALARSGVGIVVRSGAPKPDISSVDALKRALLAAKSIAYTATGQSGSYFAEIGRAHV